MLSIKSKGNLHGPGVARPGRWRVPRRRDQDAEWWSDADEFGAIPSYREAAFRYVSQLLAALMLLLAVWNALRGRHEMAAIEGVVLVPLLIHAWLLRRRDRPLFSPLALLSLALLTLGLSFYYGQDTNVYWAPALVIGFHFLLARRVAVALNLVFVLAMTPVVLDTLEYSHAVIFLLNLALISVSMYTFSLLVYRRDHLLQKVAVLDPLTQAYNRRHMMESLDQTVELNRRYGKVASLIMLDIDHFKRINDEHGHGEGDRALKSIVRLVQQRLRRTDLLFRYGGEEFVILLSETDSARALQLAHEVCQLIRVSPILAGRAITVSCGVAELSCGENALGWLARCDEALYHAKHSGRDRAELAP